MESNTKKPASVITTIVIYTLIILMGVFSIVKRQQMGEQGLIGVLILPVLFFIGLIFIFFKRSWGKVYNSVLILLFGLLSASLPFLANSSNPMVTEQYAFFGVYLGFIIWWFYAVGFGKASQEYYNGKHEVQENEENIQNVVS